MSVWKVFRLDVFFVLVFGYLFFMGLEVSEKTVIIVGSFTTLYGIMVILRLRRSIRIMIKRPDYW